MSNKKFKVKNSIEVTEITVNGKDVNTSGGFVVIDSEGKLPPIDASSLTDVGSSSVNGETVYSTPGTYSWVCPDGVDSVCVVCVGTGGASGPSVSGAGGGLGWRNFIYVVSGQSYTVVVGNVPSFGGGTGGASYFIDTDTIVGYGGETNGYGGSYYSTVLNPSIVGGGTGGMGRNSGGDVPTAPGGGGAGGYSGDGGAGAYGYPGNTAIDGQGGAGGGGGSSGLSGYGGGHGGGVGLYGEGASGTAGTPSSYGPFHGSPGLPGSGGKVISPGGEMPGFGAGTGGGFNGTSGAVRIMWGAGRSFPNDAS